MKKKYWIWITIIGLLFFGPPLLIAPSISYKTILLQENWGTIRIENTAIGGYSDVDIIHQVDVFVALNVRQGTGCALQGETFAISNQGGNFHWSSSTVDNAYFSYSSKQKVSPKLIYVANAEYGKAEIIVIEATFNLSEDCLETGHKAIKVVMYPKKKHYWVGRIFIDALMSV